MKKGNPIYGLACPNTGKIIYSKYLTPKQTKCGCQLAQPFPNQHFGDPINKERRITSVVLDAAMNKPFKNAAHVQNLSNGEATMTNPDGSFALSAKGSDKIQITHVGYQPEIIDAKDLTGQIELFPANEVLDEVVLTTSKKTKKVASLALLGLVVTAAIVYGSADDDKKKN